MKKISNLRALFRESPAGVRTQAAEMNRLWSIWQKWQRRPALTDNEGEQKRLLIRVVPPVFRSLGGLGVAAFFARSPRPMH